MFRIPFRRRRKPDQKSDGPQLGWRRNSTISRQSTADSETSTLVGSVPGITISGNLSGKDSKSSIDFSKLPQPPKKWAKPFRKVKLSASSILLTSITIGEATDIPYLKGLAGLVLLIYTAVENTTNNQETVMRLLNMISELSLAVNSFRDSKLDDDLQSTLEYNIQSLAETLRQVEDCLEVHAKRKFFIRFASSTRDKDMLDNCEKALQHALDIFNFRSTMGTAAALNRMETAGQEFFEKMHQDLDETRAVLTSSRVGCEMTHVECAEPMAMSHSADSLPPSPEIFFGREDEIEHILRLISGDIQGHVAICGPPGVGKSSLAHFILHHPDVVEAFGFRRYVVSGQSTGGLNGLVDSLLTALDGPYSPNDPAKNRDVLLAFLHSLPERALLIFDNLETAWEPSSGRLEVEDFLTNISTIPQISTLVTIRGTQRPLGPEWSKPYLPPLRPLDAESAKSTFLAISDLSDGDSDIDELLLAVEFYPLAVTILAHLAQYEPPCFLLERYQMEGSAMLSIGSDRSTDIETSLDYSLTSDRVTEPPHALRLLETLATSGASGVRRSDIPSIAQGIESREKCLAALCQSSLVVEDDFGVLRVPSPIRAHFVLPSITASPCY